MDDIVRQAMARWPNVPHCFGWLRLDARGAWRMRDERAQALDLAGDRISHPALLAFINRNYAHDAQGRWYFQNGPQRVYVDLELTPFIVQTHPDTTAGSPALRWHTGEPLDAPQAAWMDGEGRLFLQQDGRSGAVDDRDLAALLPCIVMDGLEGDAAGEALLQWLENGDAGDDESAHPPQLRLAGRTLALQRLVDEPARQFGFIAAPRDTHD